jgi:imidazolonepropionase-like amidohydrolase
MTRTVPDYQGSLPGADIIPEIPPPGPESTETTCCPAPAPARVRPHFSTAFGLTIPSTMPVAQAKKKAFYTIIYADYFIPGDGPPASLIGIVISGKLIEWVGNWYTVPAKYTEDPASVRKIRIPVVMPGLWDCHVHFVGASPYNTRGYDVFLALHPAAGGARLARACWEALQNGYTSMRDVGGYGCEVAQAIEDGEIVGPNVYSSGAVLSQTAGHGDVFENSVGDVLNHVGISGGVYPGHTSSGVVALADGVDECRKAVRLNIRRGAKCIKVVASGGIMSRDDDPVYAQFSPEELECMVKEAGRLGRSVAAHCHGKPGIMAAVEAGVATVEHVSFGDKECISLIKEKKTIYVATRFIMELLLATNGEGLPKHVWDKVQVIGNSHEEAYRMAIKEGVTFAIGTDAGPDGCTPAELECAVKMGMTPLEAIKAATANGPLTVGVQAPKTGQLKVGYEADILGLTANPVTNIKILQNRDNIKWVWKGGRLYKGPGVGPWGEDAE